MTDANVIRFPVFVPNQPNPISLVSYHAHSVVQTWLIAGPRRKELVTLLPPPIECIHDSTKDAMKAKKPKNKNAVDACASVQRLCVFGEPFVTKLLLVYLMLVQECTPRYAAVATEPQKKKSALRASKPKTTFAWYTRSTNVASTRYSNDPIAKIATNMS